MDLSKYPRTKQIMNETGATIDEIYQVIEKLDREGENDKRGVHS